MEKKKTIVLFGKPGAGKGTQMRLITTYLEKGTTPVLSFEWSPLIRTFMQGNSFAQQRAHAMTDAGERLPSFLAPSLWLPELRDRITGAEHLVIDGLPRHALEVALFDSLMDFYGRDTVQMVNLLVSDEVAHERLVVRSKEERRADDLDEKAVQKRLDWFHTDTEPLLDIFKQSPRYRIIDVDATQSREDVFATILKDIAD